jgi:hypothetical protein
VHEGFPLVTVPGANVFYSDRDESTPPDENGDQFIRCSRVTAPSALWDITKAARYLGRLAESI